MAKSFLFSSESVTEGHPDKVADQISDAVLDAIIADDQKARVACETLVTTGLAFVAGEITTSTYVHIPEIVRGTLKDIGYNDAKLGIDWQTCAVVTSIDKQSPDINQGVDRESETDQGAGDQGLMFGYACDDTDDLMPLPISLAHQLAIQLSAIRKQKVVDMFGPDGKTQVSIEFEDDKPKRIESLVVSTQHCATCTEEQVHEAVREHVIKPIVPTDLIDNNTKIYVNPTGRFVIGGPQGDCGLTGRKIIVDTYGGWARHGGGAFSGKDPSKVDRSAAYMARYVAKNVVAAKLAKRCEVQLAYAIGVKEPLSVMVDTFGTGAVEEAKLVQLIRQHFDLTPSGIIRSLDLLKPVYKKTASYGHFGANTKEMTWEQTDKAEALKADAGV